MMTGNVTQATLDTGSLYRAKFRDFAIRLSLRKNLDTVGGFLAGCVLGAVLAKGIGLGAILLPGSCWYYIVILQKPCDYHPGLQGKILSRMASSVRAGRR